MFERNWPECFHKTGRIRETEREKMKKEEREREGGSWNDSINLWIFPNSFMVVDLAGPYPGNSEFPEKTNSFIAL